MNRLATVGSATACLTGVVEQFDERAIRRILHRARGLAPDGADPDIELGVGADALVAAAEEVGYAPAAVRDSIALERLGPEPSTPSMLDRVAGPTEITADAIVEAGAAATIDLAEVWLTQVHRMACRRVSPTAVVARRRLDVAASVGRSVTGLRGDGRLGRLGSVRVEAVDVEPGDAPAALRSDESALASPPMRSALRVVADRGPARRRRLTAGGMLGGTGVATAAVGVAESLFAWPVTAVVLVGAGLVAVASGRTQAERVDGDVEALVAALAAGEQPVGTLRKVARAARRSVSG